MMENKEKNFVSAVVYVHNAEKRVENFLSTLINTLEENFEHSEIICVNDSSTDDSLSRIKKVSEKATSTSVSVINMSYFHGLEVAMNAGMDLAIGDFVFEFDNTVLDFQAEDIMKVYKRSLQGYDIVSAVPDKPEKLTSKLFYGMFDKFTDLSYKMHTESFRILSRRVINRISSTYKTIPYRKAIHASLGLKTDALKYKVMSISEEKQDRAERGYRFRLAIDSMILFTEMGYRFSVSMTTIMMLVSVFMSVYSIVIFVTQNPVTGWTTTILFLSVAFFGLFGIMTIIIKYLQLLVNLVFKRKYYRFEGVEKLTK